MKRLRTYVVLTLLAGGAGYAVYQYVLSDEDRAALASFATSARAISQEVIARLEELLHEHDGVQDTSNRDATMRQWTRLGF